jgi:16S rRNA (cytosine967-C5)-methyltransferase
VNEAVNLARQLKQSGAAGFVNAVSRRIAREGTKLLAGTPGESLAITWSHPAWLVERWLNIYGESATMKMLQTNQKPAELVLCINTLKIS